jgi:hypothetical protein
MLLRALLLLPALLLGACSISGLMPDWNSDDVAGPKPVNYRLIIAIKLNGIIGGPSDAGSLEISSPKRIESLQGASWRICLKAQKWPFPPRYYAVFMQRGEIVDSRVSVMIDQCELASFGKFDWENEIKNPSP